MSSSGGRAGFTLLEIIVVIVISGILGGVIMQVVGDITAGYARQSARQELVGTARAALERIARDIRGAVPGTVWVSNEKDRITFFVATDAGRYQRADLPLETKGISFKAEGIDSHTNGQALIVSPHANKMKLAEDATDTDPSPGEDLPSSPYASIDDGPGVRAQVSNFGDNEITLKDESGNSFAFYSPYPANRIYASAEVISYVFDSGENYIKRESVDISGHDGKINKDFSNLDSSSSSVLVNNVADEDGDGEGIGTLFEVAEENREQAGGKNLYRIRLVLKARQGATPDPVQISVQEEIQVRNGF